MLFRSRFFPAVSESLILSNLLCELAVILPVMFFTVLSGEKLKSFLGFHKIKISTVLMIVLFTFLSLPALSLFNLISQFWVENEVAAMLESQGQIMSLYFPPCGNASMPRYLFSPHTLSGCHHDSPSHLPTPHNRHPSPAAHPSAQKCGLRLQAP